MDNQDVLAEMEGVRKYIEGEPARLARCQRNGRLVIRAYNGTVYTDVDFMDLVEWLKYGQTMES